MERDLIDQYEQGAGKVKTAIAGLNQRQMTARPQDGSWSIQQIVIHLLDAELVYADRMKRVIAGDNPTLMGFDQSAFAARLHPDEQSAQDAAVIIELNRKNMARVLKMLPESAFARIGTHNERGPLTLEQLLRGVTEHLDHHLGFLEKKRHLIDNNR